MTRWELWLGAFAIVGGVVWAAMSPPSGDWRDFKLRQHKWSERCQAYPNRPIESAEARSCQDEHDALLTEARQRGWTW